MMTKPGTTEVIHEGYESEGITYDLIEVTHKNGRVSGRILITDLDSGKHLPPRDFKDPIKCQDFYNELIRKVKAGEKSAIATTEENAKPVSATRRVWG